MIQFLNSTHAPLRKPKNTPSPPTKKKHPIVVGSIRTNPKLLPKINNNEVIIGLRTKNCRSSDARAYLYFNMSPKKY